MEYQNHDHGDSAHHPNDAALSEYLSGTMSDAAGEEVQSHLVVCDHCLGLFKDMTAFFDSARPQEQMISEDIAAEWRRLWKRLEEESRTPRTDQMPPERRSSTWFNSASILALAAVVLIACGLGWWGLSQRRQKRELSARLEITEKRAAELQLEQEKLADRLRQAEKDQLDLQERTRLATESRGSAPLDTRTAELNVPIYDLYARNFNQRSGNESGPNQIKVPATANSLVFILNGEGVAPSASYGVEILSEKGRTIWRGRGLRKGHLGNLTVTINRSLLANGTYRLRLYGHDAESANALAEYILRVD